MDKDKLKELNLKLDELNKNIAEKVLAEAKMKAPIIPKNYNCPEINLAENMHRHKLLKFAFEKAMDDMRNSFFDKAFCEDDCTTSATTELNKDEIKEMMNNLENIKKPAIIEILVTKLVIDIKTVQILHDKYLCMNPIVYQSLKQSLKNTEDKIISTPFGAPVFEGEEADKRNENNMNIDRTKYLKNEVNKDFLIMVRNLFDKEICDIKTGCKKQYTPNQLIQLHRQLYLKIAYNLELKEKYSENNEK